MNLPHNNLPNMALITPYNILTHLISQQSANVFNCHIYHGSLDTAARIASTLDPDFYDVIISRGGTAEYIKKATDIPVVCVITSAMDLLQAILPYKNTARKIAFFNYKENLIGVDLISTALSIQIDEYIFTCAKDIENQMKLCQDKGYDLVVGGSPALSVANLYGLKGVLIENGFESVANAIREATAITETKRRKNQHMARLEKILSSIAEGIIVTDVDNKILIFNKSAQKIFNMSEAQVLGKPVDTVVNNSRISQVLLSRSPEIGQLQDIGNTSIITSRVPIFMGNNCIGVVCSFKDTPQIQKAERIIRGKLTKKGFTAKYHFKDILTKNKTMKELIELAKIYATTDATIMLYGESGTGKELFAQSIHNASQRNKGPFVAINCAAIPEQLLESELFGYEGGAFTGARREGKEGLIELAHNGTLFLDEIGELPKSLQGRLLRVLQEYEIMRVGGKDIIPVNIRIIGATNQNLQDMTITGTFRKDLFYRLNVLPLTIPPLRERGDDTAYLAKHLLKNPHELSRLREFIKDFTLYTWPGNIRELKAMIERLSLVSMGFPDIPWKDILDITGFQLPHDNHTHTLLTIDLTHGELKNIIKNTERKIINHYMALYNNDQHQVMQHLNISKMSLWRKLHAESLD